MLIKIMLEKPQRIFFLELELFKSYSPAHRWPDVVIRVLPKNRIFGRHGQFSHMVFLVFC